jgi:hypothetical protein
MKTLLLGLILSISSQAFADTSVVCETKELVYQNTFTLEGITYNEEDVTIGVLGVTTRTAGNESVESTYSLSGRGMINTYPAGTLAKEEITQVQFVNISDDVAYVNLVINHPGNFSSSIRLKDGTTFNSKCMLK